MNQKKTYYNIKQLTQLNQIVFRKSKNHSLLNTRF